MLDQPAETNSLNVTRLLEAASAGDEHARAIVRSGGAVTVCRMSDSVGQTRSLPAEIEVAPPVTAGRPAPRRSAKHPVPARPVVAFTRFAAKELRNEAMGFDGDEVGGALFGRISRDGTVVVEHVCGATDWTVRDVNRYQLEPDVYREIEAARARLDQRWIGTWHAHSERTSPSRSDLDVWLNVAREGVPAHIIATPDREERFNYPSFSAWIARDGEVVPAKIARL